MAARFYVAVFTLLFCLARADVQSSDYDKGKGIRRGASVALVPGIACAGTIIAQATRPVQGGRPNKSRIGYDKIKKSRIIKSLDLFYIYIMIIFNHGAVAMMQLEKQRL